jgi:hypothetical protein
MKEHPTHKGYFVTEDGRVFNCNKLMGKSGGGTYTVFDYSNPKELKGYNQKGYWFFSIRGRSIGGYRLVAETYIPNPNNLPEVNHIDKDKSNNHVSNLEWITKEENLIDAHAKTHKLKTPTGETIEVHNLKKWCKENSIHECHLWGRGKSKGFTLLETVQS